MPGVDRECEGEGATHHHACKCREEHFSTMAIRITKIEAALGDTQAAARGLLNKVNKVTAYHRHGNPIPKNALDELSNRQLDIEEKLERIHAALEGKP